MATKCLHVVLFSLAALLATAAGGQLTPEMIQLAPGVADFAEEGYALAIGDFNNDGRDEMAIGLPGLRNSLGPDFGLVRIFVMEPDKNILAQITSFGQGSLAGGTSELGSRFAAALVIADFDGDGFDDLAIGIPGKVIDGADNAGAVAVVYGGPSQTVDVNSAEFFDLSTFGGSARAGDQFGARLAAGDLNGDGIADLAISAIGDDIGKGGSVVDGGSVRVMYGVQDVGLTVAGSTYLSRLIAEVDLNFDDGDQFGAALAIGDFTPDDFDDLAVGVPGDGQYSASADGHGSVVVFFGGPGGIDLSANEREWSQERAGVLGEVGADDGFGSTLATGDFNGDGLDDLAIGVPGEDELGTNQSGAVQVLYGDESLGLSQLGDQFLVEAVFDTDVDPFDRFGEALAVGDFDGDGRDDLAVGAPLDNSIGFTNAGEVSILYGTSNGLSVVGAQLANMFFFGDLRVGDEFGFALATGRFRAGSADSLVIGVPHYAPPDNVPTGAVAVFFSPVIFTDRFESGDVGAWSSAVGLEP